MKKVTKASVKRFFESVLSEGKALTLTIEVEETLFAVGGKVEVYNTLENEPKKIKKIQTNAIVFHSEKSPNGSYFYLDSEDYAPIEVSENRIVTQKERMRNLTMIHHDGVDYDEFPVKEVTRLIYTIA
jgi:hypothetical protein